MYAIACLNSLIPIVLAIYSRYLPCAAVSIFNSFYDLRKISFLILVIESCSSLLSLRAAVEHNALYSSATFACTYIHIAYDANVKNHSINCQIVVDNLFTGCHDFVL